MNVNCCVIKELTNIMTNNCLFLNRSVLDFLLGPQRGRGHRLSHTINGPVSLPGNVHQTEHESKDPHLHKFPQNTAHLFSYPRETKHSIQSLWTRVLQFTNKRKRKKWKTFVLSNNLWIFFLDSSFFLCLFTVMTICLFEDLTNLNIFSEVPLVIIAPFLPQR